MSTGEYTPSKIVQQHIVTEEDPLQKETIDNATGRAAAAVRGIAGNPFPGDPSPTFNQTPSEYVINNERNAWIVLGVDRPYNITSGYGGKGHTQCAAIDLVAGRMASYVRSVDNDGGQVFSNPDFKVDAARVYISQKADIDDYFELSDSPMGKSKSTSAIGIKADDVRIIARNGIKLVTGTDTRNSLGLRQIGVEGIELIAGNRGEDLQPLVKGYNMVGCIKGIQKQIEDLREIVTSGWTYQQQYNIALLSHTHLSPFYGSPTSPSNELIKMGAQTIQQHVSQTMLSITSHIANMKLWGIDYLNPAKTTYINSGYNRTN